MRSAVNDLFASLPAFWGSVGSLGLWVEVRAMMKVSGFPNVGRYGRGNLGGGRGG